MNVAAAIEWEAGTAIGTIVLAAATLALAGAALFDDALRKRFRRARLSVEIPATPPDTHQIAMTHVQTGQLLFNAIYVRARVQHQAGPSAENVELVALSVLEIDGEQRRRRETFLPLSLSWSHFGGVAIRIPAGLFRHCDVGRFQPDENRKTVFLLSTAVQPNRVAAGAIPNLLPAGSYEIELLLTGDNVPHQRKRWRLAFEENWSDDEAAMLARIKIEPLVERPQRPSIDMPIIAR